MRFIFVFLCLPFVVLSQPSDFELIRKDLERVDSLLFTLSTSDVYPYINSLRGRRINGQCRLLLDIYEARIDIHNRNTESGLRKLNTAKPLVDATQDNLLKGHWLLAKGMYHFRKRENDSSLLVLASAVVVLRHVELRKNIPLVSAMAYRVLTYHWRLGEPGLALQEALSMLSELRKFSGESVYHADTYYSIGSIYNVQSDIGTARTYILKSIVLAARLGWHSLEANGYVVIGNILFNERKFSEAIPFYHKAIDKLTVVEGSESELLINYHQNLGYMYSMVGDPAKSFAMLYKAKYLALKLKGAKSEDASKVFSALADSHIKFASTDSAKAYLKTALVVKREIYGPKHLEVGWQYNALGELFARQHNYDSALVYAQKALVAAVDGFDSPNVRDSPTTQNLLSNNNALHLMAKKLDYLVNAWKLDPRKHDNAQVVALFHTLDTAMFAIRRSFTDDRSRLFLVDDMKKTFELGLETYYLLMQKGPGNSIYVDEFYAILQKSKSLTLLEEISRAGRVGGNPLALELIGREKAASQSLLKLESATEGLTTSDSLVELRFRLTVERDSLRKELSETFPAYYRSAAGEALMKAPAAASALKEKLEASDTRYVEYFWGDENLYALTWDGVGFQVKQTGLKAGLIVAISDFLKMLVEGRNAPTEYEALAFQLFEALVGEGLLASGEGSGRLLLVPDGPLAYLPFEALVTSPGEKADFSQLNYLIGKATVQYEHSSLLLGLERGGLDTSAKLLALGSYDSGATSVNSLPGSKKELDAIRKNWDGKYIYGASRKDLTENFKDFDIIHLAVHGQSDDESLNGAFLEFINGDSVDIRLFSSDLYSMAIVADLVVLSACETGLGKIMGGEGVFSIGRAFKYAGATAVVQSNWKADDSATTTLMGYFYRLLKEGTSPGEALRLAKLQLIETGDNKTAHPSRWAAMSLFGIESKTSSYVWQYIAITLILLLLFFYVVSYRNRKTL